MPYIRTCVHIHTTNLSYSVTLNIVSTSPSLVERRSDSGCGNCSDSGIGSGSGSGSDSGSDSNSDIGSDSDSESDSDCGSDSDNDNDNDK